jgi:hypothetical protein
MKVSGFDSIIVAHNIVYRTLRINDVMFVFRYLTGGVKIQV